MDLEELSDFEDICDDSFQPFKNYGKLYINYQKTCKTAILNEMDSLDDEEIEGDDSRTSKKSKRRKRKIEDPDYNPKVAGKVTENNPIVVEEIPGCTSIDAEIVPDCAANDTSKVPECTQPCPSMPPSLSRRSRRQRRGRNNSVEQVEIDADSLPLAMRLRSRRRRNCAPLQAIVINAEPIIIDDDSEEHVTLTNPIIIEDLEEENDVSVKNSIMENTGTFIQDDNYEMTIKVWWHFSDMHRFTVRKHQKLATLFEYFSKLENLPQKQILLTLRDTVNIQPTDTPDSLKINVADVIEGGITTHKIENPTPAAQPTIEENTLEFKLLIKDHKKPLLIRIQSDQNMQLVMTKCAEQLELPLNKLRFSFDGEELESSATPADLEMEGGECIDVHVIK